MHEANSRGVRDTLVPARAARRSGTGSRRVSRIVRLLWWVWAATLCGLPVAPPSIAQSTRPASGLDQELAVTKRMLRAGQVEAALAKLAKLVEEHPTDMRVVRLYAGELRNEGRLVEVIPIYRRAAAGGGEEAGPILQELEGVLRELQRDAEAFDLCLQYQEKFGERGRWVQRELESLLLTGRLGNEAVEKIDAALRGRDAESPLHRLRFSALYFAGRKEEALSAAGALDQARQSRGAELYAYAVLLEERGELDDALLAVQASLLAGPDPALGQELLYKQAQLLRRLRRVDEALAVFDEISRQHADGPLVRNVLLEKAQILDVELHRKEDALVAYEDLLGRLTPVRTADDAQLVNRIQLSMADCHLLLGRPEKAGELYQRMADEATDPAVRVEALFQVAEMLFYQGKATEAETTYYKIVDEYKTSTWTNDALERILVIGENNDFGGVPLAALAQAIYYRRLGQIERALTIVGEAVDGFPDSEAVDNLLYERTSLHLAKGRPEEARAVATDLAARYPESVFAPRALAAVGDYYRDLTGGETIAEEIYTDLLLRFPKSIEAPHVRGRLDALLGKGTDSSSLDAGGSLAWFA